MPKCHNLRMMFFVGRIYKYIENNIDKYFVYIGDSDASGEIYGGEVAAADSNRPYLQIPGLNMVLFTDVFLLINAHTIVSPLFIQHKAVDLDRSVFVSFIDSSISKMIDSYKNDLVSNYNSTYNSQNNTIADLTLAEKIIRLLAWNNKKRELKFDVSSPQMPSCIKYGVYFAYLGTNVGSEINKLRPVLIWKKHESQNNPLDNSYYVFPISSKIPHRQYQYNVLITVNGKQNVIRINDGERISGLRILKPLINQATGKMYVIDEPTKQLVKDAISKYFNL